MGRGNATEVFGNFPWWMVAKGMESETSYRLAEVYYVCLQKVRRGTVTTVLGAAGYAAAAGRGG